MDPTQHSTVSNNGYFNVLPDELTTRICGFLLHQHGRKNRKKADLATFSQVNRDLNSIARDVLFRDITITFTLKDELPAQLQQWRPQAWETPGLIRFLQDRQALRARVRSLQLRLRPFPVQEWTKESFNDIRARLKVNARNQTMAGDEARVRSVGGMQRVIKCDYQIMYLDRCRWPETSAWTADLEPTLRQFLGQLPRLQHLETVDVHKNDPYSVHNAMAQWSLSYSDNLLIRAAPLSVCSVSIKSWPPAQVSGRFFRPDSRPQASDPRRLQALIHHGAQFTELTIDGHNYIGRLPLPHDIALNSWRNGLQQLQNLTTLTLSLPRTYVSCTNAVQHAQSGHLEPMLEHLLSGVLVLQHLKNFTLLRWIPPVLLFVQKTQSFSPSLRVLNLQGIAVLSHMGFHTRNQGEALWYQLVDSFGQEGEVAVVVQQPKIVIKRNPWAYSHEVVPMGSAARLRLEEHLRQKTART